MEDLLLDREPALRLAAFFGVFAAVALAERAWPRRRPRADRRRRWAINWGLAVLNTLALRLTVAASAVGAAAAAADAGFGLLHLLDWPAWVEFACAFVLLDLVVYFQHALLHAVPGLWRLHMMHHADLDFDVTTGVRFHPGEIAFSMAIKTGAAAALGAPVAAVVAFEIVLNSTSMFNHANLALPERADRILRLFVVTPDMHRVHHSTARRETDSNFGFNLPWWDRLFGTYRPRPERGHEAMEIGLAEFRDPSRLGFLSLLALPFARGAGLRRPPAAPT